MQGLIVTLRG